VLLCHQYTVCLLQNTRIVRYVVKYFVSGIVTDKDNYSHVRVGSLRYIPEKNVLRSWQALQFIDIWVKLWGKIFFLESKYNVHKFLIKFACVVGLNSLSKMFCCRHNIYFISEKLEKTQNEHLNGAPCLTLICINKWQWQCNLWKFKSCKLMQWCVSQWIL
jgi:hypothetical protein